MAVDSDLTPRDQCILSSGAEILTTLLPQLTWPRNPFPLLNSVTSKLTAGEAWDEGEKNTNTCR